MSWVFLVGAIVAEVSGTLSLRASDGFRRRWWLLPTLLAYLVAFTLLGLSLDAGMPVGVGYGIWVAVGIALIAVLARGIWKDPLTARMILGIGLIAGGVLLVEIG